MACGLPWPTRPTSPPRWPWWTWTRPACPAYHFYLAETSAAAIGPAEAVLPAHATALHVGTLGLVMEPVGTNIEGLAVNAPGDVMVMLDPNCRPGAIAVAAGLPGPARPDPGPGRRRQGQHRRPRLPVPRPGRRPAAADLLGRGPACVLVTDGAAPVRALTPGKEIQVDVPAVPVVDTVGAGDSFGGAFLAWWTGNGHGRAGLADPELVREATQASVYASVVTCTRRGAEPPWAYELAGHDGWRWLPPA